jgi:L-seryl-tRNA(Ser) seleniumtransferase
MIFAGAGELRERADRVCAALALKAAVISSESPIGGGSTPDQVLPTWVVAIEVSNPNAFEKRLRLAEPPVIARIELDRIVLDMRTVAEFEIDALIAATNAAGVLS